jgi:hypothetical protein
MNFKTLTGLAVTTLALNLSILGDVNAASVGVKCEVRSGRAKISVDGAGYGAGLYRARVEKSGTALVWTKNLKRPVAGEVEFDYDSNRADIGAGATAIPATYIKNGTVVTGRIYSYNSTTHKYAQRAFASASCRAR